MIRINDAVINRLHGMVKEGFEHRFGRPGQELATDAEWARLCELGTTLWLDTGDLEEAAKLYTAEFEALTTNNSLLNKEIQKGIYDGLVGKVARAVREADPEIGERELLLEIGFFLNAYHGLRLVERFDARVSVELHTDLAHDIEASVSYGKRYYAVCPERFIVKVPLTASGLLAARKLVKAGVPINFTLGFSARQNYLAGRVANTDYVNVFMGRLNAFVADNGLGDGDNVGEKATLATQRMLLDLRERKHSRSKLIGASMRSGPQVAALAGLDVYTMPTKVAAQYREHPDPELALRIQEDPVVELAEGRKPDDCALGTLWDIPEALPGAVDALLEEDLDAMDGAALRGRLAEAGCADLLPAWSEADVELARKDGKIPVLDHWQPRLAGGEIGLDALMNLSALQAFVTDQAALDEHVRALV